MYSFPSLSAEARQAARWCALHGYTGLLNDPLPEGISRRAYLEIHDNLITFRGLIAEHQRDPCGGRSCDECEIGGCDHGREVR